MIIDYVQELKDYRHRAIVQEKAERDAARRSSLALGGRQHYQNARYWQGAVDAMNFALDMRGHTDDNGGRTETSVRGTA